MGASVERGSAQLGATQDAAGLNVLPDPSEQGLGLVRRQVEVIRRPGDVVVVSLHWGSNWGYGIPESHRCFAHKLVDEAHVSIVHGHSSHHPKAIEVHNNRLILYGCGDFLNDYEGITGQEKFRGDLALMYFASVDKQTGDLVRLELTPLQIRRFQLVHARPEDVAWLQQTLQRESRRFDTDVELATEGQLSVSWHVQDASRSDPGGSHCDSGTRAEGSDVR